MKSSDIALSVIIILIFVIIYVFNVLSVGIKNIQDNWPTYRCNPMVMPFAEVFGHEIMSNFTFCIQGMQTDYMKYLLQPLDYNFSVITNLGESLSVNINSKSTGSCTVTTVLVRPYRTSTQYCTQVERWPGPGEQPSTGMVAYL